MANELYEYEQWRDNQHEPACFHAQNNSFIPHFHSSIELMMVRQGEMQAMIDGKPVCAGENQMICVPCFAIHTFATPVSSSSTAMIIPLSYLGIYEKLFQNHTFGEYLLRDSGRAARIQDNLNRIADGGQALNPVLKRGLVYEILGLIMDELPMREMPKGDARGRLQLILQYLQEHFAKPLTLDMVASRFGYSKSRFSHLFNETVGCSLPHYLNMLRVKHAVHLVQEEQCSMLDAAVASGYESMRSFYRAFRQIYGCTPSEYLTGSWSR